MKSQFMQDSPLAPYLHAPTVQTPILNALLAAQHPISLADIRNMTGARAGQITRTLDRLLVKGIITRHQVPSVRVGRHRTGKAFSIPRKLWLYEISKDYK